MEQTVVFYPADQREWRQWLNENHMTQEAVWVVFKTKSSGLPSLTWSEAVDEALCFGWIDSKKIKIDSETSHQFFCKRKPKSTWSKINKDKVHQLTAMGLMTEAGYLSIETAKQNGSWSILDEVEELTIPDDLEKAFALHQGAKAAFMGLSRSTIKLKLTLLLFAKKPETRQAHIAGIIRLALQRDSSDTQKKPKK